MNDLKNWDAGLMDDPPYEHDEKYEWDESDDKFVETESSARRAQPVDELPNTFDISRTLTEHFNIHSIDKTNKKEDTVNNNYDSKTNSLMKIDLLDESKGPETESENNVDNDPKVDLFLPTPSMQEITTCPPTPRKKPLKNISRTTTSQTNPMRSKTNTSMKIMNTPRQKIDFSPPFSKKAKLPATKETTEPEHPTSTQSGRGVERFDYKKFHTKGLKNKDKTEQAKLAKLKGNLQSNTEHTYQFHKKKWNDEMKADFNALMNENTSLPLFLQQAFAAKQVVFDKITPKTFKQMNKSKKKENG